MSFEGYFMRLCSAGHLWRTDVYHDVECCPHCKEPAVWTHLIEQTNECEPEPALTLARPAPFCPTCRQTTGPAIYAIPPKVEP